MSYPPRVVSLQPRRQSFPSDNLTWVGRMILFGLCGVLYAALVLVTR